LVSVIVQTAIHLCSHYIFQQTNNQHWPRRHKSLNWKNMYTYMCGWKTKVSAFFINQITIQKSLPIEVCLLSPFIAQFQFNLYSALLFLLWKIKWNIWKCIYAHRMFSNELWHMKVGCPGDTTLNRVSMSQVKRKRQRENTMPWAAMNEKSAWRMQHFFFLGRFLYFFAKCPEGQLKWT